MLYLHTYSGNKCEGKFLFQYLPKHFDIALFDFPGCGNSNAQYITYGMTEKYDINSILTKLDETCEYEEYQIWGRSMGAVAAILYANTFLNRKTIHRINTELADEKKLKKKYDKSKSIFKKKYSSVNGKSYMEIIEIKLDEDGIPFPRGQKINKDLAKKVKHFILDSPFTCISTMLEGKF